MTDDDEIDKVRGRIDLVSLFQAEAEELIGAAERGRILHRTSNIRDSGGPLEAKVRSFFSKRLPHPFSVAHGYLFDIDANCTPQVDAMIVSADECPEMMSTDEGAKYLPFTSAVSVFEIKTSARSVNKNLEQVANLMRSISDMQKMLRARRIGGGGSMLPNVLSILFYAKTVDASPMDFKNWHDQNGSTFPTYVVLLDSGIILARENSINRLVSFDAEQTGQLGLYDHRQPGELCICSPSTIDDYKMGRTLLWLYFALLAHTNLERGNRALTLDFTNDAVNKFPMRIEKRLSEVDENYSFESK